MLNLFGLADRLHRTVAELTRTLTVAELRAWPAYVTITAEPRE